MHSIKTHLLGHLLRKVTARTCPATISSGTAESAKRNCFYAWVMKDGKHDFVVLQVAGDDAHGLRYSEDRSSVDVCVPISQISPKSIHISHIYGNDRVEYTGAWSAACGIFTGWPYAYLHVRRVWRTVAQWMFNRRSLPSRRRTELLREVITLAETTEDGVDSFALMSARHGDRWAGHPSWWSHHSRLDEQLELLVEAGDLRKGASGYRPTGQGLRTLDDADETDRKHRENVRVQWGLVVLAIASVVMAAAQAGIVKFPTLLDLTSESAMKSRVTANPSTNPQESGSAELPSAAQTAGASLRQ